MVREILAIKGTVRGGSKLPTVIFAKSKQMKTCRRETVCKCEKFVETLEYDKVGNNGVALEEFYKQALIESVDF